MAKIVLASGSPRRQELLQRIGITDFDIRVPQTEETYPAGLSPRQTVEYISREKSESYFRLQKALIQASKDCPPVRPANISRSSGPAIRR